MFLLSQISSEALTERWDESLARTIHDGLGRLGAGLQPAWEKSEPTVDSVLGYLAIKHEQLESVVGERVGVHVPSELAPQVSFVLATFVFALVALLLLTPAWMSLVEFLHPPQVVEGLPDAAFIRPAQNLAVHPNPALVGVAPPQVAVPEVAGIQVGQECPIRTNEQIVELATFNVVPNGAGRWEARFETAMTIRPAIFEYVWSRHQRRWTLCASGASLRVIARGRTAICWGLRQAGQLNWHPEMVDPATRADVLVFNASVHLYLNSKLREFGLPLLNSHRA